MVDIVWTVYIYIYIIHSIYSVYSMYIIYALCAQFTCFIAHVNQQCSNKVHIFVDYMDVHAYVLHYTYLTTPNKIKAHILEKQSRVRK